MFAENDRWRHCKGLHSPTGGRPLLHDDRHDDRHIGRRLFLAEPTHQAQSREKCWLRNLTWASLHSPGYELAQALKSHPDSTHANNTLALLIIIMLSLFQKGISVRA